MFFDELDGWIFVGQEFNRVVPRCIIDHDRLNPQVSLRDGKCGKQPIKQVSRVVVYDYHGEVGDIVLLRGLLGHNA